MCIDEGKGSVAKRLGEGKRISREATGRGTMEAFGLDRTGGTSASHLEL